MASFSKKRFSPESAATRFASSFFLAPATTYPHFLTVAQEANAARAEVEAARFMQHRVWPYLPFPTFFSLS